MTLETLARLAATFKVGLVVKFVPFSEMLQWENGFSQDVFNVLPRLDQDEAFLNPSGAVVETQSLLGNAPVAAMNSLAINEERPSSKEHQIESWKQQMGAGVVGQSYFACGN
ncbi:MAG: hypothetical protein ACYDC6_07155 [Acidobacteriaceae bacterium]